MTATRRPGRTQLERLVNRVQIVPILVSNLLRLSRNAADEPWYGPSPQVAASRFDDPRRQYGVCYLTDDDLQVIGQTFRLQIFPDTEVSDEDWAGLERGDAPED